MTNLFQETATFNGVCVKNMTNDTLSAKAVSAILREVEAPADIEVKCTHSGDLSGSNASQFDVYNGDEFIFSVDNDGVTC